MQVFNSHGCLNENSIKILSINALQKFNIWNSDRNDELISLCKYADKANIDYIVLVPLNDGSIKAEEQITVVRFMNDIEA